MTGRNLDALLSPASVAIVGASQRKNSLGAIVLDRLKAGGFSGQVHVVNPKYDQIGNQVCHRRIHSVPGSIDLGLVVTPPSTVPDVIAELGIKGARAAVVITAGLDSQVRKQMLLAARPYCLRILGPNCLGLQVPGIGLDASFAHTMPKPGHLALLSQSGAIVTAMADWADARDVGFSVAASLGDMADVDVGDILNYLATDTNTRAILMYLEHITDARKFMSAARVAARVKPVIAIKAGRSVAAARAAASHTGALVGIDGVYEAAFRRAGVLRVNDLGELFDAAEILARSNPTRGNRLAVLTNGGGGGVLAADAIAQQDLRLAKLSEDTKARLDKCLPPNWSHANPIDIIGDADAARYQAALEAALDNPETDGVLVINCPTGLASSSEAAGTVAKTLAGHPSKTKIPALTCWLGGTTADKANAILSRNKLPVFRTPKQAVRGFGYLYRHRDTQRQLMQAPTVHGDIPAINREKAQRVIHDCLRSGRDMLTEPEAHAVLAAFGVPTVETRTAETPEEVGAVAEDLLSAGHDQLAVKIWSKDITHKSDMGGVQLNLLTAAAASEAANAMLSHLRHVQPGADISGFVIQPMIRRADAHELIVGLSVDRVFGPVVMVGAGGTSVEVVADKALGLPPLDNVLAADMLDRTRISKLLAGYRNRPAADRSAILDVMVRVSQLSAHIPEITELDINPLLVDSESVIALDARIRVAPAPVHQPGENPAFAIRPYPASWDTVADTASGSVRMRPIRPSDEMLYDEFFNHLKHQDLRFRFFGDVARPSRDQIAQLTQIDYSRAMAFVALGSDKGSLLGVSRLSSDPDKQAAEFAILVRSDKQGQGIGTKLLQQLIDYAQFSGIGTLWGDVLIENEGMLRMANEFGFSAAPAPIEPGVQRVTLNLRDT